MTVPPHTAPFAPKDLQLLSYNVRGLNIPEKRSRLLRDLRSMRTSVAFLQETHFRADSAPHFNDAAFPTMFFSNFTLGKSRGVAILISRDVPFVVDATEMDKDGRYLFVRGTIVDTVYTFVSLYLPNKKQHTSLARILKSLDKFHQGITIIAGDLNVPMEPHIDSSSRLSTAPSNVLRQFRKSLNDHRLVDVWRALHTDERDFTFFSPVHNVHTRIDYFLMHYDDLALLRSADIYTTTWSDHAPLSLSLHSPLFVPRERQWRLNLSLLDDPLLQADLTSTLDSFFNENTSEDTPLPTIWEAHKAVIRGFFISRGTARKKKQVEEHSSLLKDIRTLELEHMATASTEVYQRLLTKRRSLNKLLNDSIRFQALKSRSFFALNENKPGRLLAGLLRAKRTKAYIPRIRTSTGSFSTNPQEITGEFLKFFKDLYNLDEENTQSEQNSRMEAYLSTTITRTLSSADSETLNTAISTEEILAAMKSTKNGKSPGPDGLPIEYYKKNVDSLLPTLTSLFEAIRQGTPFHPHSLAATITLIPKPNKDHTCCGN
uniref:Endonuclease/exonuclease/phosphatase domain-containing protein n=1 Tax=Leptobrachium leishanense TaxID=445787 RepID=A0A8C5LXQ3_9ANUR